MWALVLHRPDDPSHGLQTPPGPNSRSHRDTHREPGRTPGQADVRSYRRLRVTAPKPVRFRVVASEDGMTLFQLVARRLPDTTPAQAKALVKAGAVYLGHLRVRVPTNRVVTGERITVYPEAKEIAPLRDDAIVFVHRDPTFVVLDKPAGVPVAQTKASARGTLSEALRRALVAEGVLRPYVGVVHRLDQGASGLVLFTIRSVANKSLHAQFVTHAIRRTYRLRVHGDPPAEIRCDAPLRERPAGGIEIATDGGAGALDASTSFRRLSPRVDMPGTALLEAELHTGRTHQIRAHAAFLGHPIVGDRRYGDAGAEPAAEPSRLLLHASRLRFDHPVDGTPLDLRAALPDWASGTED
jgi:RluA family pseudouridine synthase